MIKFISDGYIGIPHPDTTFVIRHMIKKVVFWFRVYHAIYRKFFYLLYAFEWIF